MKLLDWPIKNPVFINMLLVLVIIAGLLSLRSMPTELNPEVSLNWVNVTTLYVGASAEDMEKLVTIKLEDAIEDIDNVETITSWSAENFSNLSVKFEDIPDEEFQRLYQELVSEIGKVDLPEGAEEPNFFKWSSSTFLPVLNIAVYGDVSEHDLKDISKQLKDEIADLSSISKINISGDRDREYWVEVIPERINALKVSFEEIQAALLSKNISISAGTVKSQSEELTLRLIGEFKTESDILETIVRITPTGVVKLKDLATVKRTFKRAASISKFEGKTAITISAYKKPGFGTQDVVNDIKTIINEQKSRLPESVNIGYATDTTHMIDDGISILSNNAMMGVILVLFILHLFLGSRNAIFAAIGIPTSFLITFIFLQLTDQSLNLSVMFGMVLVLGMIVDDAMVIIENVYRYIEDGMPVIEAVKRGVPEVAVPVSSSIMTTMAAFLPLMLMPGIMGKFLSVIPMVVCLSLAASVLEAFFIMPVHIAQFGKKQQREPRGEPLITKLRDNYDKALKYALTGKGYIVGGVLIAFMIGIGLLTPPEAKIGVVVVIFIIFIVSLGIMLKIRGFQPIFLAIHTAVLIFGSILVFSKTIQVEMFAGEPFTAIFVRVKAPEGTKLEETERILAKFEERVHQLPKYEYANVITNVGILNLDTEVLTGSNVGEIIFDLIPRKRRNLPDSVEAARTNDEIVADLKAWTKDISGVEWSAILYPKDGPPSGKAVEVKVLGKDISILNEIASRIKEFLTDEVNGVKNVDTDYQEGKTELRFYPNEYLVRSAGLSYAEIANGLQKMLMGQPVGVLRDADEEMNVVLKYPEAYIENASMASSIRLTNRQGDLIPISNLGEFKSEKHISIIRRFKQSRSISVTADLDNVADPQATAVNVNERIKTFYNGIASEYPGYRISFEGEFKEFETAFNSLVTLFLVGIGLIFIILGTQFKSWIRPFLIMNTIPLAFVGAIFGLVVSDNPFSIGSMYGMVALAGVVVNSAIVLVDFINKKRKSGLSLMDAVIEASHIRFRPVILTSTSTVFGMLPLAVGIGGSNANWQPLAIVIVCGLFVSTLLTLFLIPAFYIMFEHFSRFYREKLWLRLVWRIGIGVPGLLISVMMFASGDWVVALIVTIIFSVVAFIMDLEQHDQEMVARTNGDVPETLADISPEPAAVLESSHTNDSKPSY